MMIDATDTSVHRALIPRREMSSGSSAPAGRDPRGRRERRCARRRGDPCRCGQDLRFSSYPEQQAKSPVTLSSYAFRRKFRTNGVGMTNISKSRSKYTGLTRALAVAGVAALAMVLGNGTASAGVDNSSSVVDARGNRVEVLQGDTQFQVVPPLDGVPTSVEFFHNATPG